MILGSTSDHQEIALWTQVSIDTVCCFPHGHGLGDHKGKSQWFLSITLTHWFSQEFQLHSCRHSIWHIRDMWLCFWKHTCHSCHWHNQGRVSDLKGAQLKGKLESIWGMNTDQCILLYGGYVARFLHRGRCCFVKMPGTSKKDYITPQ